MENKIEYEKEKTRAVCGERDSVKWRKMFLGATKEATKTFPLQQQFRTVLLVFLLND